MAADRWLRPYEHWDWHECGKYGWKLMAFGVPVFTKLKFGQQVFVKNRLYRIVSKSDGKCGSIM